MQAPSEHPKISVDQLKIGLHVVLDLGWMDHPFITNSFKIREQGQIDTIKRLGLREVRYIPGKSDCKPEPPKMMPATPATVAAPQVSEAELAAIAEKKARIERLRKHRESVQECERQLLKSVTVFKNIQQNLFARPKESLESARALISEMLDSLLTDKDVAIHAVNDKVAGEDIYHHSMNVTVLAMMLAKQAKLSRDEISLIGLGCIVHDIGKEKIPDRILRKTTPLTAAEKNFMAEHPVYGDEIGVTLGLPDAVRDVIRHHHEHVDGSGYPDRLGDAKLSRPARVAAIIDAYDSLCNHVDHTQSLTPFEAISTMFAKQRAHYDTNLLGLFIHMLGVYPPGTIVQLSNEMWGIVVSVNVNNSVKPHVLVYDPAVPKAEAIILDLAETPELTIARTCRPAQLPRDAYEYLTPRRRTTYYFNEVEDAPRPGG